MAVQLASVALRKAVPAASSAFARAMPGAVARAKELVARATGQAVSSINLSQVASSNGGSKAQIVAESMVKAGYPVDQLWSHIPANMVGDKDLMEYRQSLMAIQKNESDESSAKALGASVPTNVAVQLDEKNRSIKFLMRMFGTNDANEVWNIKVELDHLHSQDIQNFLLLKA